MTVVGEMVGTETGRPLATAAWAMPSYQARRLCLMLAVLAAVIGWMLL